MNQTLIKQTIETEVEIDKKQTVTLRITSYLKEA